MRDVEPPSKHTRGTPAGPAYDDAAAGSARLVAAASSPIPRLGLCCTFSDRPEFRFRTTTVAHLSRLVASDPTEGVAFGFYRDLVTQNLAMLERVVAWCASAGIGAFRVGSDLWPRATHPLVRGWVDTLFVSADVTARFDRIRALAAALDVRLSEHPDQFLVGNSLRADVVNGTIAELNWRGRLGAAIGIDVICLHVGTSAPDRDSALWRWEPTLAQLTTDTLARLAFENDDRGFAPADILPGALAWGLPLIYDAHHHRVLADELYEDEATELAMATWGDREPYFHLSSPRAGWEASDARPHHDMITMSDWPDAWRELADAGIRFTVDIEAKAKERAVLAVREALGRYEGRLDRLEEGVT